VTALDLTASHIDLDARPGSWRWLRSWPDGARFTEPTSVDGTMSTPFPKIELHVHLEGSIRPPTLLEIAGRNGVDLGVTTVDGVQELLRFRDFEHFIEVWLLTTAAVRTEADFRQVVTAYAAEAASHGAVYLEGIFTPLERIGPDAGWEQVMNGFCDGAQQAEDETGVVVRLTPDIPRGCDLDEAVETARWAVAFRDRGVVGLGLGGLEARFPPEPYERAFAVARDGGLGSVPHAGEAAGPTSIRGALDVLHADRLRHGIRAVEDPALVAELADRGVVLDVCPVSNLRTRVVASMQDHPLPALMAAGVQCSISTDDPALFDTDLGLDLAVAAELGCTPEDAYAAGLAGALCDEATRAVLAAIASGTSWPAGHGLDPAEKRLGR
jgi:aminodeoxyfutalosine deaminase